MKRTKSEYENDLVTLLKLDLFGFFYRYTK